MANKKEEDAGGVIGFLIAATVAVAITTTYALVWLSTLMAKPFDKHIIRISQAEKLASIYSLIATPIIVISYALVILISIVCGLILTNTHFQPKQISEIIILASLLPTYFFAGTLLTISNYARSPETQKNLAGKRAEKIVGKRLEQIAKQNEWTLLHNTLLVFERGSDQEHSNELDHILISDRHVYVIETKMKSGTIYAFSGADKWVVHNNGHESTMRNALYQAKNHASKLEEHVGIRNKTIPMVAIVGKNLQIIDGPSNVTKVDDIEEIIFAFEKTSSSPALESPSAIRGKIERYISASPIDLNRHKERANAIRDSTEKKQLVKNASI